MYNNLGISKAELAGRLGVSRIYITLLAQGKRTPSQQIINKLCQLSLTSELASQLLCTSIFRFSIVLPGNRRGFCYI